MLNMTHKEVSMLFEENADYTHDENEKQAMYAIMYAAASRGKGKNGKLPEVHELYKRPTDEDVAKAEAKDVLEKQREAEDWLSRFDLNSLQREEE